MTDSLPTRGASIEAFTGKIWWADAMGLLAVLPDKSIDMVLVDLPYGVTACAWDTVIPFAPMWEGLKRVVKKKSAIVMTATEPFASKLRMSNEAWYKYDWHWLKSRPSNFLHADNMPLSVFELVLIFSDGAMGHISTVTNRMNYYPQGLKRLNRVNKQDKNTKARWGQTAPSHKDSYLQEFTNYPNQLLSFASESGATHATQKPVALFEYLIKTYTQEGEIVLDFCSGSGTTAIACTNLDRRFICCDLHEPYVIASRERLARHDPFTNSPLKNGMVQKSLFASLDDNSK